MKALNKLKFYMTGLLMGALIIGCSSSDDEEPILRDEDEETLSVSELTFSGAETGRKVGETFVGKATTSDGGYFMTIVLADEDPDTYVLNISRMMSQPFNFAPGSHTIPAWTEDDDPTEGFYASLTLTGSSAVYMTYGEETGGTFTIDQRRTIGGREYVEGNLALTFANLLDNATRVAVQGTFKGFVEDLGVIEVDDD
ncbi:hypothetical protein KI659_15415 [Litoribacter alkaliphilus]|uniref:Transferrin-binding protein B C-lobe/N-lobe beta barrel domain-containing protein n=1 Tax=Litoribacter ruber TaxID=702568 RepID=A0AAP2CMQ4_9BACT|nr:hypothetical protein [Litoribacter alkaliphilus]MBS9525405.1 hypothetical protein [Litoribacter alkaliphilus]